MALIVTLTTIPSRIKHIRPVLESLLSQETQPDQVELYLPRQYSKRSLGEVNIAELKASVPSGVTVVWIDEDLGPATKILPAVRRYKDQENVFLVYCDDDRIYDAKWLTRIYNRHLEYPDAVIAERAANVFSRLNKVYWRQNRVIYRLIRLFTLGLFKSGGKGDGAVHLAEGMGGVLVQPKFFPEDAFNIPDILWSVDDVWLSGWMAIGNHCLVTTDRKQQPEVKQHMVDGRKLMRTDALLDYVYQGHDRNAADERCIRYMQDTYGIWKETI